MHESLRFGRIAGIAVGVNWSVLVIAGLLTWSLAEEALPETYPGHPTAEYWVVGAVASSPPPRSRSARLSSVHRGRQACGCAVEAPASRA